VAVKTSVRRLSQREPKSKIQPLPSPWTVSLASTTREQTCQGHGPQFFIHRWHYLNGDYWHPKTREKSDPRGSGKSDALLAHLIENLSNQTLEEPPALSDSTKKGINVMMEQWAW